MSNYMIDDKTRIAILAFNTKYGISVDPDGLVDALESIKKTTDFFERDKYKHSDVAEYQAKCEEAIMNKYNNVYKKMLTSSMNSYVKNSFGKKFNKDLNCGMLLEDFEKMMGDMLHNEHRVYRYAPLAKMAYGGMSSKELTEFIEKQNYQSQKDALLDGFAGKSVSSIRTEVMRDYINGFDKKYTDIISMAQAIKAKNDARGFWSKFFHPIDSYREKSMVKVLCNKARTQYPNKDVDRDMAEKSSLSDDSKKEIAAMQASVQKLKKIEFDPVKYQNEKYAEFSGMARENANDKYYKEIAPKIKKMFKELRKENKEAKAKDPNAVQKEFDLGSFAKKIGVEPVSAASYLRRYLEEQAEKEQTVRDSKKYKENAPKFKEALEKGGDFTVLEAELGEDFELMKAIFIQDTQKNAQTTEAFIDMLKKDIEENLKVDVDVQAEKVVNAREAEKAKEATKAKEVAPEKSV